MPESVSSRTQYLRRRLFVLLSHSKAIFHATAEVAEEGGDVFSSFDHEAAAAEEGKKGSFEAFDAVGVWGGSGDPPSEGGVLSPDSFDGFSGNGDDPEGDIAGDMEGMNIAPTDGSGSEGKRRRKKPPKEPKERKEDKPKRPSSQKGAQPEGI